MNKLFNIGISITAEWSDADPNSLVEVKIVTDHQTRSKIWEIVSNTRLNPKVAEYEGGSPTIITLYPFRGYVGKGRLIANMAYLAAIFAQVDDLNILIQDQLTPGSLKVDIYPEVTGFVVDFNILDDLTKIWVGAKMASALENMVHNLQFEGYHGGDVAEWKYEATEALRRLTFSDMKTPDTELLVKNRLDRISDILKIIREKNTIKARRRELLEATAKSFAITVLEFGATSELIAEYKTIRADIEAEHHRLDLEVVEFAKRFNEAKNAIKEIRANTPPEPPAPIIKK